MRTVQAPLQVTLDVGAAVHQNAGLSRYTERLATYLLANHADQIDLTLFYNAHSGHPLPVRLRNTPTRTIKLGQLAWRLGVLATQLLRWPSDQRTLGLQSPVTPALYHAAEHLLPYMRRPTVMTVHDLIFERYPEHHTLRNRLFLKIAMPLFVRAADTIIAVSQHTKRDLIELYGAPADKIQVVYEGVDPEFKPGDPAIVQRVRQQYSPGTDDTIRPYLLMVGTLEPRKNHATAMRALARLKALGFPQRLLVVGGKGWLFEPVQKMVAELGLDDDVRFAGYVPAADLPALYAGADCTLLPSLYEGFGFPVLEAMACGTPVVSSNVSSLPEVAGDAALLVAPQDNVALAAAIQRVLGEPGLSTVMRTKGIEQAAKFRWAYCAQETVEVYKATIKKTA
ncbi:MAG: glycosyltransferase family 1 protein [Chloroflexi bacterium]|nr:glycosyltransferase family 1 protein [Chloroflexota bacterium]